MMQMTLIVPNHFPLQAASTAESWRRKRSYCKRLTDFFVQSLLIGTNDIRLATLSAYVPHGWLVYSLQVTLFAIYNCFGCRRVTALNRLLALHT